MAVNSGVAALTCAVVLSAPAPISAQCNPTDAGCREVRTLAERADVQRALAFVVEDDARTMRDLITLTEIPAPPFQETARGLAYAELLRAAGADSVWTDTEGNVIALRKGQGTGPVLVLSGHLDTVFPPETDVKVRQSGDTLRAPGVGDDTRGLVTVLAVLRALEAAKVATQGDLLFVGTVGEEGLGDLRGVKHLFRAGGPKIDAFISVDGSDDRRVTHMGLGSKRYRVTYQGPGGHSWGAFGIASPTHALGRAIQLFDEAAATFTASGPRTSYNVGRIGGGTSVNSVPFEAWMEVDMRSESNERLLGVDSILRAVVQQALAQENEGRKADDALTVDVKLVGDRPSGEITPDDELVQRAVAVTRHLGLQPELSRSSTDSNVPIAQGISAITIGGGGRAGDAHALTEWFTNVDGPRGIQRALLIALAYVGVTNGVTRP
jgi:acetylornithine deacetylase/succinyl-diaminopimelate desuccinylase-like protein